MKYELTALERAVCPGGANADAVIALRVICRDAAAHLIACEANRRGVPAASRYREGVESRIRGACRVFPTVRQAAFLDVPTRSTVVLQLTTRKRNRAEGWEVPVSGEDLQVLGAEPWMSDEAFLSMLTTWGPDEVAGEFTRGRLDAIEGRGHGARRNAAPPTLDMRQAYEAGFDVALRRGAAMQSSLAWLRDYAAFSGRDLLASVLPASRVAA